MSSATEHLGWLVKRVQHGHHRALDRRLASLGLTLVQWNALREIARNPGRSQHHLAEQTFNSDQAFGTLLTRLQAAGLIERLPGKGRAAVQALTPKGSELLHQGQAILSDVTKRSFDPLTADEQAALTRLLAKILKGREPDPM